MKYNFDEPVDRTNTNCFMYDARKRFFGTEDVLPLWVADLGFKTPPFITEAIRARTEHEIFSYSVRPDSYTNAIVSWLKRRHNWDVNKEWLSFSPGVVSGFTLAIMSFSEPGDKIIIQPPVYFPFFESISGTKREILENPLKLIDGRFSFDLDQLKSIIDERTKILILCSPHNPGGMVWSREELQAIGKICQDNNIMVISDEIHADLIYKGFKHTPFHIVSEEFGLRSIVNMAPSKTFNLAGLATSFLIIPDKEIRQKYESSLRTMHLDMGNIFGTIALEAAFSKGDEWLDQLIIYIENNYNYLNKFIGNHLPRIKVIKPESTYLVWLDFRKYGLSDKELSDILVNKAKLGLFPGYIFGIGGEGFIRINIGTQLSVLKEALNRLESAFS